MAILNLDALDASLKAHVDTRMAESEAAAAARHAVVMAKLNEIQDALVAAAGQMQVDVNSIHDHIEADIQSTASAMMAAMNDYSDTIVRRLSLSKAPVKVVKPGSAGR